jgi:hypothetical protein
MVGMPAVAAAEGEVKVGWVIIKISSVVRAPPPAAVAFDFQPFWTNLHNPKTPKI